MKLFLSSPPLNFQPTLKTTILDLNPLTRLRQTCPHWPSCRSASSNWNKRGRRKTSKSSDNLSLHLFASPLLSSLHFQPSYTYEILISVIPNLWGWNKTCSKGEKLPFDAPYICSDEHELHIVSSSEASKSCEHTEIIGLDHFTLILPVKCSVHSVCLDCTAH